MSTKKSSYEAVKVAAKRISEERIKKFVEKLHGLIPSTTRGKNISATSIDNWLRQASDAGRLDSVSLNRAAFEVWKRLEELGVNITDQDKCMIIPVPDIESKIARAIEKSFGKK